MLTKKTSTFWLWRQSVKPSATTVSDYITERVEIWRTLDVIEPSNVCVVFVVVVHHVRNVHVHHVYVHHVHVDHVHVHHVHVNVHHVHVHHIHDHHVHVWEALHGLGRGRKDGTEE